MAGVGDSSPFSPTARAQYSALARLRWHMFTNGIRSTKGAVEIGARIVVYLVYGGIGIGMGTGAGASSYLIASGQQWQYLPIVFWVIFIIWQVVPIMMASVQEQFDLSGLLRFPVNFPSFYLLYLVFGLVDVSTIIGGFCTAGVLIGVTVARPDLFLWTALSLAVFAVFNILLVRAIFAWIDRWLAQRRTREILTALFLVCVLAINFLNPLLTNRKHRTHPTPGEHEQDLRTYAPKYQMEHNPWMRTVDAIQKWLPPGLTAAAVQTASTSQPAPALIPLSVLGLYGAFTCGALLMRLRGEFRGENLGEAPKTSASRKRTVTSRTNAGASAAPRIEGPATGTNRWGPILAVVEKEGRALVRTMPLLFGLGAPLLLMVGLSGTVLKGSHNPQIAAFAVPVCIVYALLGFTQLFYNSLGTEGAAIHLYFLSPTPFKHVMLAKNIFHGSLFLGIALIGTILAILRVGAPDIALLAATAAWVLFALPCNLAAGNIFSIIMPYRVNPGRMSRQRGSQANALLSLLVQMVVLALGAAAFFLGWFYQNFWITVLVLLLLGAGAAYFWFRVLGNTGAMAHRRKDALIATLVKTD